MHGSCCAATFALIVVVGAAPPSAGAQSVTVNAFPNEDVRTVCPAIYGAAFPEGNSTLSDAVGFTHARFGGNRITRYNYLKGTSCSGTDFGLTADGTACNVNDTSCFEICDVNPGTHVTFVNGNTTRAKLVAIPVNHYDFSAPTGSKLKVVLANNDAGTICRNHFNGVQCDALFGQDYFDGFVNDLFGRGVREFELDNEASLWPEIHQYAYEWAPSSERGLRPTQNDLWTESQVAAANQIAALASGQGIAARDVKIWAGAFFGGWDLGSGFQKAGLPATCNSSSCFTYQFMQALCASAATGISVHWYPEIYTDNNTCRVGESASCDDSHAGVSWGRLNASRELWQDPFTATNPSLGVTAKFSNPHLIPWLAAINALACPTKHFEIAINEWRLGPPSKADVWSVGLATIDYLAALARAGVAEAHLWGGVSSGNASQAMWEAFKLFRRPDGTSASAVGGANGGHMVKTDRNADESLRAYAYKSSDGANLWVLLLNLDHTGSPRTVTVQLGDGVTVAGTATIYGTNRDSSVLMNGAQQHLAVSGSSFSLQVPGGSRLVHIASVAGASAAGHAQCGSVSSDGPPPPPPGAGWSGYAAHSPQSPTTLQSVTAAGTVVHDFATAQTVNVQTMVKNAATGAVVSQHDCLNVTIQPNQPYTCNHVATYPAGNYRIEHGVFAVDWSSNPFWKTNADNFTVTGAPSHPTVQSGAVTESSSCAGQAVHISSVVMGGGSSGSYHVQLALKDAAGALQGVYNCTDVSISAGQTVTCSGTIAPAIAGTLSVSAGVFDSGWANLDWKDGLDSFLVSSCAPHTYYGFEGSVEGWALTGGNAAVFDAFSAGPTFGHGAAYALRTRSVSPASIQVVDKRTTPLPSRGDTVSFWVAAANPSCIRDLQPFVQFDGGQGWLWMGTWVPGSSVPNVSADQWLEVKVPINQGTGQVWRIGVETRLADGCTSEPSYVDDVGW